MKNIIRDGRKKSTVRAFERPIPSISFLQTTKLLDRPTTSLPTSPLPRSSPSIQPPCESEGLETAPPICDALLQLLSEPLHAPEVEHRTIRLSLDICAKDPAVRALEQARGGHILAQLYPIILCFVRGFDDGRLVGLCFGDGGADEVDVRFNGRRNVGEGAAEDELVMGLKKGTIANEPIGACDHEEVGEVWYCAA